MFTKNYSLFYFFVLSLIPLHAARIKTELLAQSPDSIKTRVLFNLEPSEVVYNDFISLSTDHPGVDIVAWQTSIDPVNQYVPELQTNKTVLDKDFFIDIVTQKRDQEKEIAQATLHLAYQSSPQRASSEQSIPLRFNTTSKNDAPLPQTICEPVQQKVSVPSTPLSLTSWSHYLENLIRSTDLLIVRILLIALLGLLMSFTPCIYPMIPITIGIMQGQANKSLATSFLHAFSYSIGIATTFALLGLLAALSGTIFGMLLTNPLVVLLIVGMLVYLALSMFGFYEIRIPSFLQERKHAHKTSFLSSFIFGALSGTVASPCLSPGLALVLCIVASLGNAFLGFLLLFAFGIGLSIPLLLIGTFSSSLTMLPRAGAWMIEVKKIFGFLLLGMSFYYLKNILPTTLLFWLIAVFCAAAGIYYLLSGSKHETKFIQRLKIIIGIVFLTSAIHFAFQAYALHSEKGQTAETFWITDYPAALEKAQAENKYIFMDFWAPSCSICTAIDKTLLKDTDVRTALARFVPAKLELIMSDKTIMQLKDQFNIIGLPTFILYDAVREIVIKRWGGELYQADKKAFIKELESF